MKLKEWAEDDRPREKMLLKGISSLSDAELLAILIGSGNNEETSVQLSQRILHSTGNNLNELGKRSIKDLTSSFKGIGTVKAITIKAALELGKRRSVSDPLQRPKIRSSAEAFQCFYPLLADLPHEEMWMALTSQSSNVIERIKISQGGVNNTAADIRLILKPAIQALATGIVLCHNHPSGNLTPSIQDNQLTERVRKGADLVGIKLIDHLIIAESEYYSYADKGLL